MPTATLGVPGAGPTGAQPATKRQVITIQCRIALSLRQPCGPRFAPMTRLILIALLTLPVVPATADDLLPPCCDQVERPLARSPAMVWFRDANPARLGVAVARGPASDTAGFVAA